MTGLPLILLGLLSRRCRGPAAALEGGAGRRQTEAAHIQRETGARCPTTERMHV